jgi:nucleoside-diphosphate-sugar epimerase
MKTIAIAGSSGFLGRNITDFYKNKNYKLICLTSKKIITKKKNLRWIYLNQNYELLKEKKLNFDTIIFSNGIGNVKQSLKFSENKKEDIINNNLIKLVKKNINPCTVVYFSSYSVYGNTKIKCSEKSKCNPISVYAKNKLKYEQKLKKNINLKKNKLVIIRVSSIYGPFLKNQIICDALTKINKKESETFFGTGDEERDFLHVSDAINAIDLILKKNKKNFQIYNCGSGNPIKIKNLLKIIVKKTIYNNKNKLYFSGILNKEDPKSLKINIKKLKNLGWKPVYKINNGINNYKKWFKKQSI